MTPRSSEKWAPALYFVIGQIGWFASVLSTAKGVAWLGVIVAALLVAGHLARVRRPLEELKLVVGVTILGALWECAVAYFGLLAYPSGTAFHARVPFWLFALWALFAAQFNTTYRWMKTRIPLAALLGACAGPLSFRSGAALGAVQFVKPWPAAIALAVGWAAMLPLIVVLSRRWDGVQSAPEAAPII